MIISAEEFQKIVKLLMDLFEAEEIAIKELVEKKVAEALEQHLEDYEHKEKVLTVEEVEAQPC